MPMLSIKHILLATTATTILATAPPTPSFVEDFTMNCQSDIMLKQGDFKHVKNQGDCCAEDSPGCQLQGMYSADKVWQQGSMNRTKRTTECSNGKCIIASLYNINKYMPVPLEMTLSAAPKNSTYDYVCNELCPLSGTFSSEVKIGNIDKQSSKVKYLGKETVTQEGIGALTKECDHYQWSELLFKTIPIQTTDFYVDSSGKSPLPFFSTMDPVGNTGPFAAFNVHFNESYLDFAAANLTGHFNIDPTSFATCPKSSGCNGGANQKNTFGKPAFRPRNPRQEPTKTQKIPTLASDYFAHEETVMLSNSGGVFYGTDVCCSPTTTDTVNDECMVTRSKKSGVHYVDVTNQRERFEDAITGKTMVTIYGKIVNGSSTNNMDMIINVTNGVETCESFCPMLDGEYLQPLSLDPNATDQGQEQLKWNGMSIPAEHWRWSNYDNVPIVGKKKMEQVEFYVTEGNAPAPLFSETRLEPYGGPQQGSVNTTYTKFNVGTVPASKFQIAGMKTCPQAKNCQIELWQSFRLATQRYDSFYYHRNL